MKSVRINVAARGRRPKSDRDKRMLRSFFSEVREKARTPGMTDADIETELGIVDRAADAKDRGGVLRDLATGRRHSLSKARFLYAAKVAAKRGWCGELAPLRVVGSYEVPERDEMEEPPCDSPSHEEISKVEIAAVFHHLQAAMRILSEVALRSGGKHRAPTYLLNADCPDDGKVATALIRKTIGSIGNLFKRIR